MNTDYFNNMNEYCKEILQKFDEHKTFEYLQFTLVQILTVEPDVNNFSMQVTLWDKDDEYLDNVVSPYGYDFIQPVLNEIGMMKMLLAHNECAGWNDSLAIQTMKDGKELSDPYDVVEYDIICSDCTCMDCIQETLESHISNISKEEQEKFLVPHLSKPSNITLQ